MSATRPAPRPCTPSDHEWLFQLHDAAHRDLVERAYGPWEDGQQRAFFTPLLDEFDVFLFEHEGVPVASVYLGDRDGDVWIELVEVDPRHQGRGIGTAVLSWTVERAHTQGKGVLMQVHRVNADARRLYLREGFEQVDQNDTHDFLRHP
ncbi:GNAT family N-acetyltransferase [Angustibacter luteus]|uniref:GNAT family N-acetyltransferase n=1 Tax=Angustibacter luteus TaxID=658456 RepID=A0ABW1JBV1_9ACTN